MPERDEQKNNHWADQQGETKPRVINGVKAYSYHPNLFPWWGGGTATSADFNNTKPAGLQRLGHSAGAANTQSARWSWGDRAPMLVEGSRLGLPFDLFQQPKSHFSDLGVLVFICFIFVPSIQAKEKRVCTTTLLHFCMCLNFCSLSNSRCGSVKIMS